MNNNSFSINHYDDEPIINEFGFREYDARWIYPKQINLSGIKKIGCGLGQLMVEKNIKKEDKVSAKGEKEDKVAEEGKIKPKEELKKES